jgi:ribosomal protein S6--L-glutamate ligase
VKLAILSRNEKLYSTRRLVEAARQRGHHVDVVDYVKSYVLIEKDNPTLHFKNEQISDVEAVIPRIGSSHTFYGTAIVRQFEMMGIFSANESQAIARSRDKLRSLQLLSRAGVGMPLTAFASNPQSIDALIEAVGGAPVVMKLLQGTQGIGVVLAETKKAAKSVMEAFYGLNANVLIQEYIEESKGEDIRALVVGGEVVAAMKRKGAEGDFRSNLHRGGSAELIQLTEEESRTAVDAVDALGLNVAGVDMLQSNRGPLIMEVNSSPGLEGIEKATKQDIAGKIIEFVVANAHIHNHEQF